MRLSEFLTCYPDVANAAFVVGALDSIIMVGRDSQIN